MSTTWRSAPVPRTDPGSLELPRVYRRSYGGTLLARPVVLHAEHARRVGDDVRDLCRLLVDLPARLTGGHLGRFADLVRVPAALRPLTTLGDVRRLPLYARADLLDDGTDLRLVELNFGSELGGVDAAQMGRAWLADAAFGPVGEAWRLGVVDTAARTADLLRRAGERVGRPDPRCALVEARGALADHAHVFVALREALADHGVDLELAEIQDLRPRDDGRTDLGGAPVDVVLRYFAAHQLVGDADAVATYTALEVADARDRTALVGSLSAHCLASKAALAVLHATPTQAVLADHERALVHRLVPWTGLVADLDGPARDRVRAERADHVLKPGIGYSGVGTVVGDAVDDARWAEALRAAAATDCVVQRRVRPAAEVVVDPATGRAEDWHANWGVFVTAEGYAGGFVRALRPGDGAVIGYGNAGTRGAPVLTSPFPGPPSTGAESVGAGSVGAAAAVAS